MKNLYLIMAGFLLNGNLIAQEAKTTGIIDFTETRKLELKIEGDGSQFASSLPDKITSAKQLVFTPESTLYRKKEADEIMNEMMETGNQTMKIVIEEPANILYTDLSEKACTEQKEFMTRKFLVEGPAEVFAWKLTGEQEIMLGYSCQKAVAESDSSEISAWFTSEIPMPGGPAGFGGLPGMILRVEAENGDRVISASAVSIEGIPQDEMKKPRKGKKVTDEEFRAIVAERAGAHGDGGGGGKMMMIEISQ